MSEDISTLDFSELYELPLNTFEEVKVLPAGKHFYGKIVGWDAGQLSPKPDGRPGTKFIQCNVLPTDPGEDVTPEDVEGVDIGAVEVNYKFWVTKAAMPMLRRFLTSLGINEEAPLGESIQESRGMRVLFSGSHTERRGGGQPFYNVDSIVGA